MILFTERNANVNSCVYTPDLTLSILIPNKHTSGHCGTSSFSIKQSVVDSFPKLLISGQCRNISIKDPLFPQPCQLKSDVRGFILFSLYGVVPLFRWKEFLKIMFPLLFNSVHVTTGEERCKFLKFGYCASICYNLF